MFLSLQCNDFLLLYKFSSFPIFTQPSAVTLCVLCMPKAFCGLETVRQKAPWTLCALWEIKLPSNSQAFFLTWRVRSISHRFTQKNRTHRVQKDDGPSPFPSPEGKGSDHRDTPMANHQHLTTISQHPSLAVMLCELCMPEAFCGLEMCAKKALCALWEIKLPSNSQAFFLTWRVRSISHRRIQKNRIHSIPQRH